MPKEVVLTPLSLCQNRASPMWQLCGGVSLLLMWSVLFWKEREWRFTVQGLDLTAVPTPHTPPCLYPPTQQARQQERQATAPDCPFPQGRSYLSASPLLSLSKVYALGWGDVHMGRRFLLTHPKALCPPNPHPQQPCCIEINAYFQPGAGKWRAQVGGNSSFNVRVLCAHTGHRLKGQSFHWGLVPAIFFFGPEITTAGT